MRVGNERGTRETVSSSQDDVQTVKDWTSTEDDGKESDEEEEPLELVYPTPLLKTE